jgi:hypothetical protein
MVQHWPWDLVLSPESVVELFEQVLVLLLVYRGEDRPT